MIGDQQSTTKRFEIYTHIDLALSELMACNLGFIKSVNAKSKIILSFSCYCSFCIRLKITLIIHTLYKYLLQTSEYKCM